MSEDKLQALVNDILEVVEAHIIDNAKGLLTVDNDYWTGRLFSTQDIRRDIREVIKKHIKEE